MLLAIEAEKRQGNRVDLTSESTDSNVNPQVARTNEVAGAMVGVSGSSVQTHTQPR